MRLHTHALVLAAGEGRRFGGDKLHALHHGRPLLSYVFEVVTAARERGLLEGGHAVIAANDEAGLALAAAGGLDTVINDAPDLGLSHSVQLGVAAVESQTTEVTGAILVFLGDQPLVRVDVVEALVAAWRQGLGPIIRPRYEARPDTPGHPVLLGRSVWPRARQLKGDRGFSALQSADPRETVMVNVKGDNPDVDTRADLNGLGRSPR